jgi:transcriptional regulator GlxA family with amidase domain
MQTRRIAMVAFDNAQILDIAALEVFSRAARLMTDEGRRAGPPPYQVEVLARKAGPVTMSSGLQLIATRRISDVRGGIDTLLVSGGVGVHKLAADSSVIRWLQRMAERTRRMASICTGTFLLARAGLLDGKRVTTHWASCERLQREYAKLTVDPDPIFVKEGRYYTSAGVTAGLDLALALVEEDHGPQVAREVARQLVLFLKRPGGQSQFSAQLSVQVADRAPLGELTAWMADHLREDLTVEALARRASMSPRNFARVFTRQVGVTPARLVERLRVEAARRRLEESIDGVEEIADDCGFGSAERMRCAFLRTLRVPPSAYRSRFADAR